MKKSLLSLILSFLLVGCSTNTSNQPSLVSKNVDGYFHNDEFIFPLNTFTALNMYDKEKMNEVFPLFNEMIISLSKEVDRYHTYDGIVNLKSINDSCGTNQKLLLSDELFEILKLGVELTKLTEGRFNLALGNLIDLYSDKFSIVTNENTLPDSDSLQNVLLSIPSYEIIDEIIVLDESDNSIILNKCNDLNVTISLGALAKGYVMQKGYDYLKTYGNDFFFNSGNSTIGLYGNNPLSTNGYWKIGLFNPTLSETDEYLATLSIKGEQYLSTSGDYQQYFFYEDDNNDKKMMNHIIDPFTGVSNDYLRSVSLISSSCSLGILDALSTTLFNVKSDEEAKDMITLFEQTYNVSINYVISKKTSDNNYTDVNLLINEELEDYVYGFATNVKKVEYI